MMDLSINDFLKIIKKVLPKFILNFVLSFFGGDKRSSDESSEEKRERDKEPDTLLLLGIGGAVMAGVAETFKKDVEKRIDDYEVPDIHIDWDDIFGITSGSVSASKSFWDFTIRETPKGVPKGFRQAEKITPTNMEGYVKYNLPNHSAIAYGNPMDIRPRMNEAGTEITERQRDIWQGETGHYFSRSGTFVAFSDPYYSVRAAAHLLMTYSKRDRWHNKHNIHDWLYTYCPTKDRFAKGRVQATQAYVDYVVNEVNKSGLQIMRYDNSGNPIGTGKIDQWTNLNICDKNTYMSVLKAMAYYETRTELSWNYMSMVYDADLRGGIPPTKENLLRKVGNVNTASTSNTSFSGGKARQSVNMEERRSNG